MFATKTWNAVKPGSTLHVAIDPASGPFGVTGSVLAFPAGSPSLKGPIPGLPLALPINADTQYRVKVEVLRATTQDVEVTLAAEVRDPNGQPHGQPFRFPTRLTDDEPVLTVKLFVTP